MQCKNTRKISRVDFQMMNHSIEPVDGISTQNKIINKDYFNNNLEGDYLTKKNMEKN